MSTLDIPYVNINMQLFGKLSGNILMGRPQSGKHVKLGEITETATITLDDKIYTLADIREEIKDDTILYRIGNVVYCIPLPQENATTNIVINGGITMIGRTC